MTKYRVIITNKDNVKVERTYEKEKDALKQIQYLLEWGHKQVTIEKFNINN